MKPSRPLFIVLTIMTIVGGGCANFMGADWADTPRKAAPASAKFVEAQKLLQTHKYAEAISAYRLVLQEQPGTEWSPEAKYAIALAYISADNPARDYGYGLAEFDEFLAQYPQDPRADEARSWRAALKTVLDIRKENDRLTKNIEKLKQLDVRQEEKRTGR